MKDYTIKELLNILDDLSNDEDINFLKQQYLIKSLKSGDDRELKLLISLETRTKERLLNNVIDNLIQFSINNNYVMDEDDEYCYKFVCDGVEFENNNGERDRMWNLFENNNFRKMSFNSMEEQIIRLKTYAKDFADSELELNTLKYFLTSDFYKYITSINLANTLENTLEKKDSFIKRIMKI